MRRAFSLHLTRCCSLSSCLYPHCIHSGSCQWNWSQTHPQPLCTLWPTGPAQPLRSSPSIFKNLTRKLSLDTKILKRIDQYTTRLRMRREYSHAHNATPLDRTSVCGRELAPFTSYQFVFTERSYAHANWYTKVRRGSESLTDPMLAKVSCSDWKQDIPSICSLYSLPG